MLEAVLALAKADHPRRDQHDWVAEGQPETRALQVLPAVLAGQDFAHLVCLQFPGFAVPGVS